MDARRLIDNGWLVLAVRIVLGGIFVASAVGKLQHPALFVDTVVDYGLLPQSLSRFYGTVLPWTELAIGFSLILGLFSYQAAILSIALTVSFGIAAIASFFRPAPEICGCFGELVALSHSQSLALDVAMLLMAVLIIAARGKADVPGVAGLVSRLVHDKRKWLVTGYQLALVVLLTAAVGLGIRAAGTKSNPEPPVTEKPRLMYFWNGCSDCYGVEVNQVKSLQIEYGDRVDFAEVDFLADASALSKYGVADDDFTVLFFVKESDTEEYTEQARFVGNLEAGTFNLEAIEDGMKTLLDAG